VDAATAVRREPAVEAGAGSGLRGRRALIASAAHARNAVAPAHRGRDAAAAREHATASVRDRTARIRRADRERHTSISRRDALRGLARCSAPRARLAAPARERPATAVTSQAALDPLLGARPWHAPGAGLRRDTLRRFARPSAPEARSALTAFSDERSAAVARGAAFDALICAGQSLAVRFAAIGSAALEGAARDIAASVASVVGLFCHEGRFLSSRAARHEESDHAERDGDDAS
jgi:hypothetical protein